MGDSEEPETSHIKLHQMPTFPQGAIVKASYQPKIVGGTTAVIVSTATTHLQTSTQVSRISTIPIQTGPTASYHVPRGAAVVAAMSAPRSSVATPVLRGTPQPLPMNARAVLPAGVQAPRPTAKIPSHHVSTMRGRGVAVASKQQINVSGRLLGPTLVAASRPPHTTIITSNVVTKPVMLSSTTMVRAPLPGQATAKIFQTTDATKIYHQTDQSTAKIYQTSDQSAKIYQSSDPSGGTKIYQSDQAKIYQQTDQATTTAKLFQTDQGTTTRLDQSTSTSAKLFPTVPEGTTVKVYQTTDQSGNLQTKLYHTSTEPTAATAKIFTQTEQASQQPQPIYIQHKPQIVTGSMYMSQTGSSGNSGGVVVASGISQQTVVLPQHHSQHHSIQSHPTVLQPQQMGHSSQTHGTVMQSSHGAMIVAQHQGTSVLSGQHVQHGSIVPHSTVVQQSQPHGTTMVQTHVGLVQQPHTPIAVQQGSGSLPHGNPAHITVSGSGQTHSMVVAPKPHGLPQPSTQSSQYIEIPRPRPAGPQSQPSTSIQQQSSSCQVMRFNPVVVVEAGRTPFQGLINATSSVNSAQSDSATLTALPSGVQSIVQPSIQGIAMSSNQPQQTATLHQIGGVGQQVNISGQIAGISGSVSIPAGSIPTASSIPQALSSAVAQSLTPKQNTSPRPSILRKRDNTESWSGNLKAQRNLGPVLSGLNLLSTPPSQLSSMQSLNTSNSSSSSSGPGLAQTPVTPQSQPIPDDDAPLGSGGSSTLSAASSPDQAPIVDQPSPITVSSVIPTSSSLSSSPRKKPRKQQLPHNPPPSRPSPFSDEDMQFLSDKPNSNSKDYLEEDKKKRMSLLKTYKQPWKPANNHFLRYCDVRTKEEKKLTLTELANQKNASSIINGWKVYHLLSQIDDLVNTETEYCDLFSSLLNTMEERQQKIKNKNPEKKTDEILNRLNERIKANAQRCKVVNDHMHEARGQFLKLFDHKTYVADLINRFANKRPVKKRERV